MIFHRYSPTHGFAPGGSLGILLYLVTEVTFALATRPLVEQWINEWRGKR